MDDDTGVLLSALEAYFARYLVVSPADLCALALWTLHTYVYEAFDTTPYLLITSAEKGSGKTRVFECIVHVVKGGRALTALTEAVLFRIVHTERPTLLIDETDAIFRESKSGPSERQEGLRAILNAGYRRGTEVARCLPGATSYEWFNVYGPKALAGIGHLPDTIQDRGLIVRMTKKLDTDVVERLRYRKVKETSAPLVKQIEEWASGKGIVLAGVEPDLPEELDDRAQDAYEVLIAIADLAGKEWGEKARRSLIELRQVKIPGRESMGVRLLRDLGNFLPAIEKQDVIPTADLLALLYEHGDEPWSEWWRGKDDSYGKKASMGLAKLLREYGILPGQHWHDGANKKCYKVEGLLEAYARHMGKRSIESIEPFIHRENRGVEVDRNGSNPIDLKPFSHAGSIDLRHLLPHGEGQTALNLPSDVSQSPKAGSAEWLAVTPIDEIRKYYE